MRSPRQVGRTITLGQIVERLERIAPTHLAEAWDNVGLLVGDASQQISRAMLTIDYTAEVAEEARSAGCDLIIAYHPPIFDPLKRLLAGNLIFDATRRGVAIYSPHTALDVADGGTNDLLADAIGLQSRQAMCLSDGKSDQYKLVVFVPPKQLEPVSQALFDAGAGHIGRYSSCSFRTPGRGTFFAQEGAHPAVGETGHMVSADEIRLETVVPIAKAEQIIAALRSAHPYEEPAFDLHLLAATPGSQGQGRIGTMPATDRGVIFARIKKELNLSHLLIAGPTSGPITRAAVCAGSCGQMLEQAIAAGAELYLTGEMRHHDAVRAAAAGLTVVCTLHSNSERAVLVRVKKSLEKLGQEIPIQISTCDRDPFAIA